MNQSNVIPIEAKQQQAAPAPAEFTIPFSFEGFNVTAKVTGDLAHLRKMMWHSYAKSRTVPQRIRPAQASLHD